MLRKISIPLVIALLLSTVATLPASAQAVHWSCWINPVGSNGNYEAKGTPDDIHDGDWWTWYGALVHKYAGLYGYGAHVYGQALFDSPITSPATVRVSMNSPGAGVFEIYSYDGLNWNKIYSYNLQGYKNVTVNLQNSYGIKVHLYYAKGTSDSNYDWTERIYEIDVPAIKPHGTIEITQIAGYIAGGAVAALAIAYAYVSRMH